MADASSPRIYTRTGDAGETGLFDGTRVSKADARVEAYGDVDELASLLGVARAQLAVPGASSNQDPVAASLLAGRLEHLQRDLFALGAHLADPRNRIASRVEKTAFGASDTARLEAWIDELESGLPPLRRFILAGGGLPAAQLHLARAVCRRAERRVVILGAGEIDRDVLIYLNRLSDLLFVMARVANAAAGIPEVEW